MIRVSLPAHLSSTTTIVALTAAMLWSFTATGCSDDPEQTEDHDAGDRHDDAGSTGPSDPDGPDTGFSDDATRPDPDAGDDWNWGDEEFTVDAVIPARGPLEGGTRVDVVGDGLSDSLQLWFADQPVDAQLSDGRLVAETPPTDTTGPVTVRAVSADGEHSAALPNGFTYSDPVLVNSIAPSILPTTGGIEIDIAGSGFDDDIGISFSDIEARHIEAVDDQLLRVITPPMPPGDADVRVTTPDEVVELDDAVHFFEPLEIKRLQPAVGSVDGGQQVVIHARGLDEETTVYFDGVPADVHSYDTGTDMLTVISPPADTAGPVDVAIHSQYDAAHLADEFFYDDADRSLRSIQPETASLDGSAHLVSGRGFDTGTPKVVVDGQPATILEVESTHAVIEVPTRDEPGAVDVIFEHNGIEVDRLDDGLKYLPELDVTSVTPATGDPAGGETLTVSGQGLDEIERVWVGGISAAFDMEDGELLVTTPASEPGDVDITVSDGHRRIVTEDAFRFEAPLEIWSMHPSRGSIAGNTYVTLQGRGFFDDLDVLLGEDDTEDVEILDAYNLAFRTPPAAISGEREVLIPAVEETVSAPYPFVYFDPTSSIGGAFGPPVDGAINVSVVNVDGTPVPGAFVMLSTTPDTPYRGFTDANGHITLSGPDVVGPQTVTATAAELSTFTIRELNAQNLTVVLNPVEPHDGDPGNIDPPPMAYFEGTVSVTGKQPSAEGGVEVNESRVRTTQNSFGSPRMPPGDGATVPGEGEYELRSTVGDLALVVLCGYHDEIEDSFTPKLMGVHRNLAVTDGDRIDIDLECDIPVDSTLPVQLLDPVYAPEGPTQNQVTVHLDFGYEGVFNMPGTITGSDDILHAGPLPAPEGPLDDIEYAAIVGSYTNGGMPLTRTTVTGILDVGQIHTTPALVAVPELKSPEPGDVVGDKIWVGYNGINHPDLLYLTFNNPMGLPVWTFVVPGGDEYIPMPRFPSFSDLPADQRPTPYVSDELYALAYAPRIHGFDYDAFNWHHFQSGQWAGYAADIWDLSLAE